MKQDPKNTRASQRQPLNATVDLVHAEGQKHLGFACDISLGGLGMVATQPVAQGGTLPLRLKLPSGAGHLQFQAQVVHQRYQMSQGAYALGMVWVDLAERQQATLLDLLRLVKIVQNDPFL